MPDARPYDALLVVSFGGPEEPADVLPFLQNVTRGRSVPPERLTDVGEHYHALGGRSPINDQNRALVAAIEKDFADAGLDLPVYWGNRNWHPYLTDTLRRMTGDGVRRAAVFVTAAYASYSGCRQYREDLADALAAAGPDAPTQDKLRHYFNHAGFVAPMVRSASAALRSLPAGTREGARLVFVTHSIPTSMAASSGPQGGAYVEQHLEVARLVADGVARAVGRRLPWELVYCSRSGSPGQPWLEPDVNDHLQALQAAGAAGAVVVPIGFISDHMEVVFDLDVQARATADRLGLPMARASTVGTAPDFVAMVRELVLDRAQAESGTSPVRPALGRLRSSHDLCPRHCCPNPRGGRPAACESA